MTTSRNVTLDVAKGFTLLTLPAIHSTLFYSTLAVQHSFFGHIMAFIAEGAGAPVFMLTMGMAITLGKKKTLRQILFRCLLLFFLAYLLNFLKFVLPGFWDGIPEKVYTENAIPENFQGIMQLFLIGDILQLAAMAYFICALLYRCKHYYGWALALLLGVLSSTPFIWQLQTGSLFLQLPLSLINGLPPASFFPLFPWLCYPLLGLVIGHFLQQKFSYNGVALIGGILLSLGFAVRHFEPLYWENNFYRLGPGGSLIHLGIALIFLYLCHLFIQIPPVKNSRMVKVLSTLSREVTFVYMLQWVIVCWLLPLFGYHQLPIVKTLTAIVLTTSLTILLTYGYLPIKEKTGFLKRQSKRKGCS